jgi:hypothetical protein
MQSSNEYLVSIILRDKYSRVQVMRMHERLHGNRK